MVALPQSINVDKHAYQSNGIVHIPDGVYKAIIPTSELRQTKSGGQSIVFTVVITEGQYANTEFEEWANIVNTNEKTVASAYRTIANIGKSVNLTDVNNTEEVHNKPLLIEIATKKGEPWTDKDGVQRDGKDRSIIKKYMPLGTAPIMPAAPTAATPAAATSGGVAAPPPWVAKK